MGKAEDWESQSIVKGNGKGHSDAVVGVQMKEIDGLKKVDDRWSMVGKGMGKSIVKSIVKGNGDFFFLILSCLFYLFFFWFWYFIFFVLLFFFKTMLTWKFVEASKVSVIYI